MSSRPSNVLNASFPVDAFLPYMRDVSKCAQSLHELNLIWRLIESSARMNCPREAGAILPTMAATRARFHQLEEELVINLAREKLRNVHAALMTKSAYVIEIVVRNLFERTADVGFLATDGALCAFAAGLDADVHAMRQRLRAYRDKYTVYDQIIVLDLAGHVLVQLDQSQPVSRSDDALIARTLACDNYVETFRASDLCPGKRDALIYSRRLCHPETGAVVGVLCLCFAFEEEMARIFSTHRDPAGRSNMLLLDAGGSVIASADPGWMPLGTRVPVNHDATPRMMMSGGREYLVCTTGSAGYQGYPGPQGWQGQVMIPLDIAFGGVQASMLSGLDAGIADGLLVHARSFCPALFDIMGAADSTAETIRRVVWNGQVTSAQGAGSVSLKTVLEQISETGARSNTLFAESIHSLFDTVLAAGLHDAEYVTNLLVDLLDRNLYERANDCRWWALSPELQRLLAIPQPGAQDSAAMTHILATINGLYTVYACLFVYDRTGRIVASTGPGTDTMVDAATLQQVLALRSTQDYHVSPFAPSARYGNAPTYVYHAAIRNPLQASQILGGIGIVFDATPEFAAMLRGGIGDKPDTQAFFVDRRGTIIASTDPARPIGTTLDIDSALLALDNGESASRVVIDEGRYALLGCTVSHGYREFKVSDSYRADVIAVVLSSVGEVTRHAVAGIDVVAAFAPAGAQAEGPELATFFVGTALMAIAADQVREALPASRVAPISIGVGTGCGCLGIVPIAGTQPGMADDFVWVFDLAAVLSGTPSQQDSRSQVVVVRFGNRSIGLLVDQLHGVGRVAAQAVAGTPMVGQAIGNGLLVQQVFQANEGKLLIQMIDLAYLFKLLMAPAESAPEASSNVFALTDGSRHVHRINR
ncbi:chemotaxis protein CheW [Actimicrobium sp. CCI2.3]|uniref:chemotaxis protein CheW n=1 Tax=Actimicrobium sp. CCI2.3 TaxID=3048616 RepID=UPI002AB56F30|nr:chemotaxis protein CheW [Actimicrobium sp. CCI2.3]MDY7574342.1 chemotaxis protein CheW [Actimicrobium sp. CCI2.3]MEB0023503.1 chemotaxis protein CheW [Actimicrobium sp. CCI2.3]